MAPRLRKKLVCYYCSRTSSQKQDGTVHEWLCKKCDAVNYLDPSGEHAYPPPLDGSPGLPAARYARSIPRPASPDFSRPSKSPFCERCRLNQHSRTEMLSGYLPEDLSENDPEYQRMLDNEKSYLQGLDERYPQVCANCEPRVREIISESHRFVKADNLRRVMERSKNVVFGRPNKLGWRDFIVFTGATCYWASIAIQLVWNTMGTMATESSVERTADRLSMPLLFACLRQAVRYRRISGSCLAAAAPTAGLGLVLGLASLWWNPRLKTKMYWRRARMAGLRDYYRLQIIAIVARFVSWEILQNPESEKVKASFHWAIHLVMLVMTVLVTLVSYRCVQIDTTPQISWKESPESLLSKPRQPITQESHGSPPTYHPMPQPGYGSTSRPQRFPLEKIVDSHQEQLFAHAPPTPPAEIYDDPMDWTPQAKPNVSIPQESQIYREPSSPLYRSNNEGRLLPEEPPSPTISGKNLGARSYAPLAPAKYSQQQDTGLEDIFDSVFSLGTTSISTPPQAPPEPSKTMRTHIFGTVVLSGFALAWYKELYIGQIEFASLGTAAVFSGLSLHESLSSRGTSWSFWNIVFTFSELVASVVLGQYRTEIGDSLGKALLGLMAFHEVLQALSSNESSRRSSGSSNRPTFQQNSNALALTSAYGNLPVSPPDSQELYESLSQPPPSPAPAFDALTFGGPTRPLSSPKLFKNLSLGSKPPSSSPFYDPHNPPALRSNTLPPGADRQRLLHGRRAWDGLSDTSSGAGGWRRR